ncbi:hypothetical protein RB213_015567, partial [Colletotrichum asianum]
RDPSSLRSSKQFSGKPGLSARARAIVGRLKSGVLATWVLRHRLWPNTSSSIRCNRGARSNKLSLVDERGNCVSPFPPACAIAALSLVLCLCAMSRSPAGTHSLTTQSSGQLSFLQVQPYLSSYLALGSHSDRHQG